MIAHILKSDKNDQSFEQSVGDHCRETAKLCARYAAPLAAENIGTLQGLLHDVGKLTEEFQLYIREQSGKKRGDIDHSYAGGKYLMELATKTNSIACEDTARLISHTIISHHGLHDWVKKIYNQEQRYDEWQDYLLYRIGKSDGYAEILSHLVDEIGNEAEIVARLNAATTEYAALEKKIKALAKITGKNKEIQEQSYGFYLGMLERFLQSCLVDADRIDTADFYDSKDDNDGEHTEKIYDLSNLWGSMARKMQTKLANFARRAEFLSDKERIIANQRRSISDRAATFAAQGTPVHICRLVVPTGGGKTLASLRFAIDYCQKHNKQRIIYTAPFMSILEQNSSEFKEIVGETYGDCFIEHHSNMLAEKETENELKEYELRTERWDVPVIATTMVQFLNTLFLGKTSSVRRMHRLANAVIIIDEVQSLPLKCVHLFNLAINFLAHICGSTVVLCSATQPAMENVKFPLLLDEVASMTGDTENDFSVFKRTEIVAQFSPYGYSNEEAADFCCKKYEENGNVLLIVNTKAAAKKMFTQLKDRCPQVTVIYLSTNLCPAHRREKIAVMKEMLKNNSHLICVTTQLIEAGVDISFRCVIRSAAGLDSVAQAAGRCNRHGESDELCKVYVINFKEENVMKLQGIRAAQQVAGQFFISSEERDYLSYDTQKLYFQKLYNCNKDELSYKIKIDDLKTNLLTLLSYNRDVFNLADVSKKHRFSLQQFKTAGDLFEVIDSNTLDILVPYNEEAENIIAELDKDLSYKEFGTFRRKAQSYMVSVYMKQAQELDQKNAILKLKSGVCCLNKNYYNDDYGIDTENAYMEFLYF